MRNAQLVGDEQTRVQALNNLGVVAQRLEDYPRALEIYAECEEVCHRLGNDGNAAIARANRADTLALLGRFDEAAPFYASALEMHERLSKHACRAEILSSLGHLVRQRRDLETAARHYRAAREIS